MKRVVCLVDALIAEATSHYTIYSDNVYINYAYTFKYMYIVHAYK